LAVCESTQGEFPGTCKTSIKAQDNVNEITQQKRRAMAAELYYIFPGE
jgi:hypothetical protein